MTPSDTTGIAVSLRGITQAFGNGTVALEDLSLDLCDGEVLSLLGPSGCGKSSALRIIAGLSEPTAGSLEWPGAAVGRDGLAFVFQEPTLMPWASVFDNVFMPLRARGRSRSAARDAVLSALSTVGLEDFAGHYPRELSGGMKMRVSIARALVTRPRLLLMDEPFAALDEITRFRLNDELLALQARFGWTVLFVTHSVYEAVYLSDRIAVMSARPGRITAEIDIGATRPRSDSFRNAPDYARLCQTVSDALKAAMAGSPSA